MSDFHFKTLFGDRVYVELDELPKKSAGGILLPETQAAASRIGTVRQIGPEVTNLAVGDRVFVSSYTGVGLYLISQGMTDATHSVYRENEIVGTIE
jgi:co-chaperonin GroES (HSP10)